MQDSYIKANMRAGGIVGGIAQYGSIVEKCYNIGDIEGTSSIGGIAGSHGRSSKIENSYNQQKSKRDTFQKKECPFLLRQSFLNKKSNLTSKN